VFILISNTETLCNLQSNYAQVSSKLKQISKLFYYMPLPAGNFNWLKACGFPHTEHLKFQAAGDNLVRPKQM